MWQMCSFSSSPSSSVSTSLECILLYIYPLLLLINPYKLTQEKDLLCVGELGSGAVIEWKCHRNCCRRAERESGSIFPLNVFHSFHSKLPNRSIFQEESVVMTSHGCL